MHRKIYAFKMMYPFLGNGKYDYDTMELRCGILKKVIMKKKFQAKLERSSSLGSGHFL